MKLPGETAEEYHDRCVAMPADEWAIERAERLAMIAGLDAKAERYGRLAIIGWLGMGACLGIAILAQIGKAIFG